MNAGAATGSAIVIAGVAKQSGPAAAMRRRRRRMAWTASPPHNHGDDNDATVCRIATRHDHAHHRR